MSSSFGGRTTMVFVSGAMPPGAFQQRECQLSDAGGKGRCASKNRLPRRPGRRLVEGLVVRWGRSYPVTCDSMEVVETRREKLRDMHGPTMIP